MPTAELQLAMHRAGVGPAALVPVPSGTVLLLRPAASLGAAVKLALRCGKFAGRAVVLCWDDIAAVSYSVLGPTTRFWAWGERGRSNVTGGFMRKWFRNAPLADKATAGLSAAFGVEAERVRAAVAEGERGGPDAVTTLLGAAGLPDVAQVVSLVHAGQAEQWVAALARPGSGQPFGRRKVRGKPINAVLPVIPVTQGAVPTEQPPA